MVQQWHAGAFLLRRAFRGPGLHSAALARCRGDSMRRFAMVGAVLTMGSVLGVLALVAGSTAAWACGPEHVDSTEQLTSHSWPASSATLPSTT